MPVTEKTLIGTIDCTPTWSAMLPALLAAYQDGTPTGRGIAIDELKRMAAIADQHVAAQKPAANLTQDQADFVDAMTALNPTIGKYVRECAERGVDPRGVISGLETALKTAVGWCIGRFGRP